MTTDDAERERVTLREKVDALRAAAGRAALRDDEEPTEEEVTEAEATEEGS